MKKNENLTSDQKAYVLITKMTVSLCSMYSKEYNKDISELYFHYAKEDIAKLIEEKKVLAIKADTTVKDYPATLALKNIYNEPGVPVTILFVPGQKEAVRWRSMSFAWFWPCGGAWRVT